MSFVEWVIHVNLTMCFHTCMFTISVITNCDLEQHSLQSCSGAWVWLIHVIILQLYRLVPVLFTPVQQFHPTCLTPQLCTLSNFLENFLLCLVINRMAMSTKVGT